MVKNASSNECPLVLDSQYDSPDVIDDFKNCFQNNAPLKHSDAHLLHAPFKICEMENFFTEPSVCATLRQELEACTYAAKSNDLYRFKQTKELSNINSPCIKLVREYLNKTFFSFITRVTDIQLYNEMSIMSSSYNTNDILLCHDDELEKRRIAFVLYITPDWKQEEGGALDVFDSDDNRDPGKICKSLYPKFNKLVWFEVAQGSYHQVAEVLGSRARQSIHGWFYAGKVARQPRHYEPRIPRLYFYDIEERMVYDFINPMYLRESVQNDIRRKFISNSEIMLDSFLREDKYQEVSTALKHNVTWKQRGPPNKRQYETGDAHNNNCDIITRLMAFMQSEAVSLILSNLTGITLNRFADLHDLSDHSSDEDDADFDDSDDFSDEENDFSPPPCDSLPSTSAAAASHEPVASTSASGQASSSASGQASANSVTNLKRNTCQAANSSSSDDDDEAAAAAVDVKKAKLNSSACNGSKRSRTTEQLVKNNAAGDVVKNGKPVAKHILRHSSNTTSESAKCYGVIRKWSHGCYTLLHDDSASTTDALDAMFFVDCEHWEAGMGGFTSYITKDEDQELLTITPKVNSLSLVYRDTETLRFVKYVNATMKQPFYDIYTQYFEVG